MGERHIHKDRLLIPGMIYFSEILDKKAMKQGHSCQGVLPPYKLLVKEATPKEAPLPQYKSWPLLLAKPYCRTGKSGWDCSIHSHFA